MSVLISAAIAAVLAIAAMADAQCTIDPQTAVLGNMPLNDLGPGSYKGFEGGLYPGSLNYPPPDWEAVGVGIAENQIRPLDAAGNPSPTGKIVLTAIGFTNTRLEFDEFAGNPSLFIPGLVSTDPANLNPDLVVVNALEHGTGRSVALWADPRGTVWDSVVSKLLASGVTPEQVQVVWIKQGMVGSTLVGNFPGEAIGTQDFTEGVIRRLKIIFPNARIAYLSSRTHPWHMRSDTLNPEPYAYESAFGVKWLIENQINGTGNLNHDPLTGPVVAPYLAWGPYTWADGDQPRSDGLTWGSENLDQCGFHPSSLGAKKVAHQLMALFKTDPTATPWFLSNAVVGQAPTVTVSADVLTGTAPLTVHFGAAANDPDGSVVQYVWSFGDGSYSYQDGASATPTKTFTAPGDYVTRVTVTDDSGNTTTGSVTISVVEGPGSVAFDWSGYFEKAIRVPEGIGRANILVSRRSGRVGTIQVQCATSDDNAAPSPAIADVDYVAASRSLTFGDGVTSQVFGLDITDDVHAEGDETFRLTLTSTDGTEITGLNPIVVKIVDDDGVGPGSLRFDPANPVERSSEIGSDGYQRGELNIVRQGGSTGTVSVDWEITTDIGNAAVPGNPTSPGDFIPVRGTAIFEDGMTQRTIQVHLFDDAIIEPDKVVVVKLSNPTGGASIAGVNPIALTIADDDGRVDTTRGQIQFPAGNLMISEDEPSAIIPVIRLNGKGTTRVPYATFDGSALAADDYSPVSGTAAFTLPGLFSTFTVPLVNDLVMEADETVNLTLGQPTNGATLIGPDTVTLTISDDDGGGGPPDSLLFSPTAYAVNESAGLVTLAIDRVGALVGEVSVDYETMDGTATTADGDYVHVSGTLTFPDGARSASIDVQITDDSSPEAGPDEKFVVRLHTPVGAALGQDDTATVFIRDDDLAGTTSSTITTVPTSTSVTSSTSTTSTTSTSVTSSTSTTSTSVTSSTSTTAPSTTSTTVPPTELILTSIAAEDGVIIESQEDSNVGGQSIATGTGAALRIGDNALDRQMRLVVSFDTSAIPDGATILSATLRLQRGNQVGSNPFGTHGAALVDVATGTFGGSAALVASDFEASATAGGVAALSNAAANQAWSEAALNAAGLAAINTAGRTQFRAAFEVDDNDNGSEDSIAYYSGESATRRPQLVVTYRD